MELQKELAAAYDRVGDVRGEAYSAATLAMSPEPMESYLKALQIREALVAAEPSRRAEPARSGPSYVRIG